MEEERFETRSDLSSPTMLGLCSDMAGGAFYAYDESSIYEVISCTIYKIDAYIKNMA